MQSTHFSNSDLTISVIIPVYKGGKNFQDCINALAETVPPAGEIIVVADGGMDHMSFPDKKLNTKILQTSNRSGPARARNIGAQAAKSDILFFLDADVTVKPDSIQRVLDKFKKEPHLTAVFGSYDNAPAEPNFLSQYRNLLHHYVHQTAREDASTFWGACGAISRDVFHNLGGFDEKLYRKPMIEDIELGYRLKRAGYKIRLCKTLQVKHLKRWGVVDILKTDFLQRALPWTKLILRNRQFLNDLNLATSSRISVVLTYGLLVTLIASIWSIKFLVMAITFSLALLALNMPLYHFFQRKHGNWFALKTIPWHWLYYFYGGLAFGIGFIIHLFGERK